MEDDLKRVSLEGRTYSWTGNRWIDIDTFNSPPAITVKALDAILLSRLKEEDERVTDLQQLLDRARDAKAQTQYSRAEGLARRTLQLYPGNLWAVTVLCSCLRTTGKPDEALKESAPYEKESYPPLIVTRAAALCDLGRWEEAKIEISRVLSFEKKNDVWRYSEPLRVINRIKSARPDLFRER